MNLAYVYRHVRVDKNEVFYIGISLNQSLTRAYSKHGRSDWWRKVTKKTSYRVEILLRDLTKEEACEKEKYFIKLYGRRNIGNGTLINLTDGGDGTPGCIAHVGMKRSMESRNRISASQRGRVHSSETKDKQRAAKLGGKQKPEHVENMANAHKKILFNLETGIFYYGFKDAAESANMKRRTLNNYLRGYNPNKSSFIYG